MRRCIRQQPGMIGYASAEDTKLLKGAGGGGAALVILCKKVYICANMCNSV